MTLLVDRSGTVSDAPSIAPSHRAWIRGFRALALYDLNKCPRKSTSEKHYSLSTKMPGPRRSRQSRGEFASIGAAATIQSLDWSRSRRAEFWLERFGPRAATPKYAMRRSSRFSISEVVIAARNFSLIENVVAAGRGQGHSDILFCQENGNAS